MNPMLPEHFPAKASPDTPLVSVVVPTYNCERYIDVTIGSLLKQTHSNVEIIVIDDGSTDRTREIVSTYAPKVRLISQQNAGVCAARNRGITEAAGEFVCLMDHDDYWFPHKLSRQIEVMRQQPECGIVFASFIRWGVDKDGQFPPPESFDVTLTPDVIDPEYSGFIYHQLLLDCWMLTSTAMFRREVFEKCGRFDEALPYGEDWELWLRISRDYRFVKLARPNTLYRQHQRQGSRVVRAIDYRTRLLIEATDRWGLCSPDGHCLDRKRFLAKLAAYHAEFAFDHLRYGNRKQACQSYWTAWKTDPTRLKFLAHALAALAGWRRST